MVNEMENHGILGQLKACQLNNHSQVTYWIWNRWPSKIIVSMSNSAGMPEPCEPEAVRAGGESQTPNGSQVLLLANGSPIIRSPCGGDSRARWCRREFTFLKTERQGTFTINFTFHVSTTRFFSLSFHVIFWQCRQFSLILLEVFSTLHSCLFNMSLVPQQIIVSQSEYLPYFWSTIPFSTSSPLAVSSEQCRVLIFLYFGHSVTPEQDYCSCSFSHYLFFLIRL